jgi:hypothetical protein
MYTDPSGNFAISIGALIAIIVAILSVAVTAQDIYYLNSDDFGLTNVTEGAESIEIENSYHIITPWMKFGYSFYLNHFNESTKDIIKGTTMGMQYEWMLHNVAYRLGFGGDPAKNVNIGVSIFADGKSHPLREENGNISPEGIMSLAMRITYVGFSDPLSCIWDLIVNGGF